MAMLKEENIAKCCKDAIRINQVSQDSTTCFRNLLAASLTKPISFNEISYLCYECILLHRMPL